MKLIDIGYLSGERFKYMLYFYWVKAT